MKAVNVHEAKTNFSALLVEIEENGTEIVICRNGKPVADLVPHCRPERLRPHPIMKKIEIHYDETEPLDDGEWPERAR